MVVESDVIEPLEKLKTSDLLAASLAAVNFDVEVVLKVALELFAVAAMTHYSAVEILVVVDLKPFGIVLSGAFVVD